MQLADIHESWSSNGVEKENTLNFPLLVYNWKVPKGTNGLDLFGTEIGLDQHEVLHTNEELADDSVELSCVYVAATEYLRPATPRGTFFHGINPTKQLPSQFEESVAPRTCSQ